VEKCRELLTGILKISFWDLSLRSSILKRVTAPSRSQVYEKESIYWPPFIIVSDAEGKLRKLYGFPSTYGIFRNLGWNHFFQSLFLVFQKKTLSRADLGQTTNPNFAP
jgi:hypothetical protein